jgi:hypothetical protein
MFEARAVRRALLASTIAVAMLSVMLAGTYVKADDLSSPISVYGATSQNFISWLFMPIQGSIFVLFAVFAVGVLGGGGFVFLEYHSFKIGFEQVGMILPYALPLIAVGAVASTLVLHKYNFFLLSLYMAVPMIIAPILYLAYVRYAGRGKGL